MNALANASRARLLTLALAAADWAQAAAVGQSLLAQAGSGARPAWFAQVATAYLKLGDKAAAQRVLNAGLAAHPGSTTIQASALSFRLATHDWTGAIGMGEALLRQAESGARPAWFGQVATAHLKLGNKVEAQRVLSAGLEAHPGSTTIQAHSLNVRIAAHDWVGAVAIGQELLARTGTSAKAPWFAQVAKAHLKLGDKAEAQRVLTAGGPVAEQHRDGQWVRSILDAQLTGRSLDYGRLGVLKYSADERRDLSDVMPVYAFGSCTKGIADWQRRWDEASADRRVMMIAPKDFSGSMYKLAEAANRHSEYAVRLVTFHPHEFGYANDLVVPEVTDIRRDLLLREVARCRILHLKDEHSWFGDAAGINTDLLRELFFGGPRRHYRTIFTTYGGWARSYKDNVDWRRAVLSFDARAAMTPDLNFDWYRGDLLPHAIDTDSVSYCWADTNVLGHSSSTMKPRRKGTELLFEATRLLERRQLSAWQSWEVDFVIGVDHEQAMARKRGFSLYFDQAGREPGHGPLAVDDVVGWYGNAAVEALAMGIPTLVHIRQDAASRAASAGVDVIGWPLLAVERDPEDIADKIGEFVSGSSAQRGMVSRQSRAFAEEFHSYRALAARLTGLYGRATRSPLPSAQKAAPALEGERR